VFYANKPVDPLIRPGLRAADLNDDSLGRALDALYDAGVTEVFAHVQLEPMAHYGRRERPRAGELPPQVRWRVVGDMVEHAAALAVTLQS
jgi:Domain of unknown function (DUF4277)